MSVINKEPFIRKLIASLTSEQKATLAALVNGGGNQTPILRTLSINPTGNRTNITNSDKGVKLCDLEINYSLFRGYLIFNNSYCVLISFTDSQKLSMFRISEDKHNFATVDEELNVLELRLELFDLGEGVTEAELQTVIASVDQFDGNVKVYFDYSNGQTYIKKSDMPDVASRGVYKLTDYENNECGMIALSPVSGNTGRFIAGMYQDVLFCGILNNTDNNFDIYDNRLDKVKANLTLSGGESSLSSITIGSTKYKVLTESDMNTAILGAINDTY